MTSQTEIYTLDIKKISRTEIDAAYFSMSSERRKKCDGFRFQSDKDLCVAADMLLRRVLSEKTGIPPEELVFSVSENGKPYLENGEYHFNVSHSGNMVAVAVNESCPVGIDVEKIRPVSARISKRAFSDADMRFVFDGPVIPEGLQEDRETLLRFFTVWTYKEAFVKMTGEGICGNIKTLSYDKNNCITEIYDDYVLTVITGNC